jgi:hypothetical protein
MAYRSASTHSFRKDSDLEIISSQRLVLESGLSEHRDGTHLAIDMSITH